MTEQNWVTVSRIIGSLALALAAHQFLVLQTRESATVLTIILFWWVLEMARYVNMSESEPAGIMTKRDFAEVIFLYVPAILFYIELVGRLLR